MAKIPLEKTIGGAYNFLFSNILSVIGIVWLPYLVFGSIGAGSVWYWLKLHPLSALHFDKAHFDPAPFLALTQIVPVIILCALLAGAMVTVGLMRKALGKMDGPTFVYFSLGMPVWRLLGSYLLLVVIYVGTIIVFAVAGVLWGLFGQKSLPHGPAILIDVFGIIAMALWVIYMMVRLVYFIPAVVVAEEKVGVGRSWQLGRGNFWRIFVVFLLIIIPPAIVYGILNAIVTTSLHGAVPFPSFASNPHPDPQQMLDYYRLAFARAFTPAAIALQLVYAAAMRALYAGAVATAYRGVTAAETPSAA